MSSDYFLKATEYSIDLVYETPKVGGAEGETVRVEITVPRGQIYEFKGNLISQQPTPDTPMPSEGGMAGGGYVEPERTAVHVDLGDVPVEQAVVIVQELMEEKKSSEAELLTDQVVSKEQSAPAPARRGRKTNAEKAAEAAAAEAESKA